MTATSDRPRPYTWQGPAPAGPPVHTGCGRRHRPFTPCPVPADDDDQDHDDQEVPDHNR